MSRKRERLTCIEAITNLLNRRWDADLWRTIEQSVDVCVHIEEAELWICNEEGDVVRAFNLQKIVEESLAEVDGLGDDTEQEAVWCDSFADRCELMAKAARSKAAQLREGLRKDLERQD